MEMPPVLIRRRVMVRSFYILCFLFPSVVWAQGAASTVENAAGGIEGRVSDTQQLALPQPIVELLDVQDHVLQKTVGDDTGRYQFNSVPAGTYILRFSHIGFESTKKGPVTVASHQTTLLAVTLKHQQA